MEKKSKKVKTVVVFYVIIIMIVISSFLYIVNQRTSMGGVFYAEIYQNGELYQTVPLDEEQEAYTITIESDDGGINEIEVRDGKIGFVYANCPDELCVDMGFVGDGKLPLVCLPHHLVIKVTEAKDGVNFDGIAY